MQRKFEKLYRGILALLFVLLLWSVWRASAQSTNAPAAEPAQTNSVTAPTNSSKLVTAAERLVSPAWIEALAADLPFLKRQLWGNELWKYLFSLLYIFLAFYISKLLDFLTRIWLKRWAERTTTKFDDLVLELLNGPVKVVTFVIFLRVGLDVFDWPPVVQNVSRSPTWC
jgi:MscS family membrane protein